MAAISSIRTTGDKIEIVDQLLLPHTQEWIEIDTIEKAYEAIKSMKVCVTRPQCLRKPIMVVLSDPLRFGGRRLSVPWLLCQWHRICPLPSPRTRDQIS